MGDPKLVITGDISKLEKALHKAERKIDKLAGKVRDAGKGTKKSFDSVGSSITKAFDPKRLGKMLIGLGGIQKILGDVKAGFEAVDQARDAAALRTREAERGLSSLAQLAGGNVMQLQMMVRVAKQVRAAGGAESLDAAGKLTFELQSANLLKQWQFASKLEGIADPAILARSAGKLRAAIGVEETGTFRQIVSKAFAAAGPVTGAGAPEILEATLKAAPAAAALGLSDEELLAITSIVAQKTKQPRMAATQVAQLLTQISKKGIAGEGVEDLLAQVGKVAGKTEAERIKFFGNVEAQRGYAALAGADIAGRVGVITEAAETDLAGRIIKSAGAMPEIAVARMARIEEGKLEVSEFERIRGAKRLVSEAMIKRRGMEMSMEYGEVLGAIGEAGLRLGRKFFGDREVIRVGGGGLFSDEGDPQDVTRLKNAVRDGTIEAHDARSNVPVAVDPGDR